MDRTQADIREITENESLFALLAGKRVLITGATGLIGSMLAKTLLAANDRYSCGINITGMIRDQEKARKLYKDQYDKVNFVTDAYVPCDFIIHTASPTASGFFIKHPVETIKSSVTGTMDILEVARNNRARMIYLSSMEQYGVPYEAGQKMTESDTGIIDHMNVRSSYPESKRLCECMCASYAAEYGVDVRIARLAQTFGAGVPLTDKRMPMQFAGAVLENSDIVLHTEGASVSNFIYLTDAISGILTILNKGESGQAYNVCNDRETRSVREIAELVAQKVAGGRIKVRIEKRADMGYAPDVSMYLDSAKLRGLGWNARVDMEEAYRRLTDYLYTSCPDEGMD